VPSCPLSSITHHLLLPLSFNNSGIEDCEDMVLHLYKYNMLEEEL